LLWLTDSCNGQQLGDQRGDDVFSKVFRLALFLVAFSWQAGSALGQSLGEVMDRATGVSVRLPLNLLGQRKPTKWGSNWQSADRDLEVDVLSFGAERSLAQLHATLTAIKGRRITKNVRGAYSFVLEGKDADHRSFLVLANEKNGAVRALSITFQNLKLAALAQSIASSFRPFPEGTPESGAATRLKAARPRLAQPETCHLANGSSPKQPPQIVVTVNQSVKTIRTGDPLTISWRVDDVAAACRDPLYLVFSTPMRTRFQGNKLLALPPDAAAPYQIKHRLDRTRLVVPLHFGAQQQQGKFAIKVFETGALSLDWALVEIPHLVAAPESSRDLAIGSEKLTLPEPIGQGITVVSGNPKIVVRDQFSIDTPKQVIRSNSGEFDLFIFDGFYRVVDVKTGELLQERAGLAPNFSPGSRFLGAYATGPGVEIIDLYAGEVIASNDRLHREHSFVGNVHMVGWSNGDAIMALSLRVNGGFALQQSLVDDASYAFPHTNCHRCQGIQTRLFVDSESGIISARGQEVAWSGLFDRSLGTAAAKELAFAKFPVQPGEFDRSREPHDSKALEDVWKRRNAFISTTSARMIEPLATAGFFASEWVIAEPEHDGSQKTDVEQNWWLLGQMHLSHLCYRDRDNRCIGRITDLDDVLTHPEDDDARMAKLLVAHRTAGVTNSQSTSLRAEDRLADVRRRVKRGGATNERRPNQLWTRIGQLLQRGTSERPLPSMVRGTIGTDATQEQGSVAAAIARALPNAQPLLKPSGDGDFIDAKDIAADAYYGLEKEARFIDPRAIRQATRWQLGDQSYWLVSALFDYGASSRNWLFLLHGSERGSPRLVDLTHRLRYSVGRRPNGLNESNRIEITEEYATTMGFGGWPRSFDRVRIVRDRYLVTSGLWTIDERRWILVYDLRADLILYFNRDLPEAPTFADLALSEDGRLLLLSHDNGHFYIHDVEKKAPILSGVDIDDEIVIYDERRYYASTPEGAQFVFLKFPGVPGYQSFQQFARTLDRPDIIMGLLEGKGVPGEPRLPRPPQIELQADVANDGDGRRALVKLRATSATGLRKLLVFVDGRRIADQAVIGQDANGEIRLNLQPESRWITALAIDTNGHESVPRGRELPRTDSAPIGKLLAVAVGTDRYEDERITQLKFARSDAVRIAEGMNTLNRVAYAHVDVETLLDANNLQIELPAKIRAAVSRAGENDTIVLFAAGHGVRDTSTNQFYLVTRNTRVDKLAETSVSWTRIAGALEGSKARVFVIIDACQSGAAGNGTNDDVVTALLGGKTAITVLAAAKGRQSSLEVDGGGIFTTAIVKAITSNRSATDSNHNGAIELAELYGAVKRQVVTASDGEQTPWIARNQMVGEIPLF
jgi:Caspase domain